MKALPRYPGVYVYTSTTRRHKGRPDVCYYVRLYVDGKKRPIKIGWASDNINAAFAAERRRELVNQVKHGKQPMLRTEASIPLSRAWEMYRDKHVRVNLKHPAEMESKWASLVEPYLASRHLDEITPMLLEDYKGKLKKAGKAPKTIEHGLALVRAIYRKMRSWHIYMGENPTADVAMPRYSNKRSRWLSPTEAKALMTEIKERSASFYRLSLTSLYTGMRFGEVAALMGEHINVDAGTIRVQDTKSDEDRTVFITPTLLAEVFDVVDLRPGHLVFPARGGGRRTEPSDTFRRAVDTMRLNDDITDNRNRLVFHSLRHTFGSWLAQAGVPLYWIAKLMGHSNEQITERYAHLCPDVQRQAVDHIEAFYHSAPSKPDQQFEPGQSPAKT